MLMTIATTAYHNWQVGAIEIREGHGILLQEDEKITGGFC